MKDVPTQGRATRLVRNGLAGLLLLAGSLLVLTWVGCSRNGTESVAPPPVNPVAARDIPQRIQVFCGACHANPPADTFPREHWKYEIERMYMFYAQSGRPLQPPPIEEVVKYYEERAPLTLPPLVIHPKALPHGAGIQLSPGHYPHGAPIALAAGLVQASPGCTGT